MFASVAIWGAGVAGLATARALAARGCSVQLIDDGGARAQNHHVHRLTPGLWQRDAVLADALRAVGCGPGECGAQTVALLPTKTELEAALLRCVQASPRIDHRRTRGVRLRRHGARWMLTDARGAFTVDAIIDASGAARATLPQLGERGLGLAFEQVPGRQTYVTQIWQGAACGRRAQWQLRSDSGHALLAQTSADARLTLTHLHHAAAALPALLLDTLGPLERVGPARRWRAVEARRLVLHGLRRDTRWFAVGDALLQTPPWQGQGVAQAFAHAETLATCLERNRCPLVALDALAQRQLIAASLGQWALPNLAVVA